MATVAELREGLAGNLDSIADIQVSAYRLTRPTPPVAHVFRAATEFDTAGSRGEDLWTFTVQVLVAANLDKGAQLRLDRMLAPSGDESVKAAIESDRTLGGKAYDCHVKSCSGDNVYQIDGIGEVLGADFLVEVRASGA